MKIFIQALDVTTRLAKKYPRNPTERKQIDQIESLIKSFDPEDSEAISRIASENGISASDLHRIAARKLISECEWEGQLIIPATISKAVLNRA